MSVGSILKDIKYIKYHKEANTVRFTNLKLFTVLYVYKRVKAAKVKGWQKNSGFNLLQKSREKDTYSQCLKL